jgi:hypothetical protein
VQQSRFRRRQSRHLRQHLCQRSKVTMATARSERRRTQKEYIAAKIATETKARRVKGFTLPTFGPRPPDTSAADAMQQHLQTTRRHAVSRASMPMSFMQVQRRPGTSPEPSSRADIVNLFDQHVGPPVRAPVDSESTARIANPNLNQGRGSPRRPPSSITRARPTSVAW